MIFQKRTPFMRLRQTLLRKSYEYLQPARR